MLNPETLKTLKQRLHLEEGFEQFPYRDQFGYLTIGIGRNLSAKGLALDEALDLLQNDIAQADHECFAAFPWYQTLDEVRKSVICDMCFQMGIDGLRGFQHALDCVKEGAYKAAAQEMRDSRWYKETPKRCESLARMMETGVY